MLHPINQSAGQQKTFGVFPGGNVLLESANRFPVKAHEHYQRFSQNVESKRPLKPEAAVSDIVKPEYVLIYFASGSNQESMHGPQV